jgi:hypothetical protein
MSLFRILVELIGYSVARSSLPHLSFGWIYVEPFSTSSQRLSWPFYRRDESGRIEMQQAAAGWFGFGLCLIVPLATGLLIRAVP